jgi:pimeloyl-ACP methyl ester carboxylesterase
MKIMKWLKIILLSILGLVFSLILIGFAYEHISRFYIKRNFPIQGKLIDIGDHKLNLKLKGNGGPLVVFESGLDPGGSLVWDQVQDEVSTFTSTASYDRAGILWSERGNNPKTGEAMAMELYKLLKKADQNGPYILVGHSLAGYFLRSFVAKYPEEILGIIFVEAAHPDQSHRFPEEVASMPSMPPDWILEFVNSIGIVRQFRLFFANESSKTDSLNIISNSYLPVSVPAVLEEMKNTEALAEEAGKISSFGDIPLIVITGTSVTRREDYPTQELGIKVEEIWMQMQKELLELSTNSEHVLASKSGHYVQLEQPEVVIEAIRKMLTKAAVTSGPALK